MTRRIALLLAGLVLAAGLAQADTEAKTLKIATVAPDGTTWMKRMRAAAARVNERTEGRVEFKFYPGGVMGNDKAVLRKIRIGQLHGGAFTGGDLASVYPDIQVLTLPLRFRSWAEADYVRGQMTPRIRKGLAQAGFRMLGISNGGFAYLFSQGPVTSVDDLTDKRAWIPQGDTIGEALFEAAGVSPVQLPLTDVYTALQTGLLDTAITTPTGAIAFQWHTKVDHMTDVPLAFTLGVLVVDRKAFDGLAPADRRIVNEVFGETFEALDKLNRDDNREARQALKNQGIELVQPGENERRAWQSLADETVQALAGEGAYSREALEALERHVRAFRQRRGESDAAE